MRILGFILGLVALAVLTTLCGCGMGGIGGLVPVTVTRLDGGVGPAEVPRYRYLGRACVDVYSGIPLDVARVDNHLFAAEAFWDAKYGKGAWCKLFYENPTTLTIVDGKFQCPFPDGQFECQGWYGPLTGIIMMGYSHWLLHEVLHLKEASECNLGTGSHAGWVEKGYYDFINQMLATDTILEVPEGFR
jgi:hypothetical protein